MNNFTDASPTFVQFKMLIKMKTPFHNGTNSVFEEKFEQ